MAERQRVQGEGDKMITSWHRWLVAWVKLAESLLTLATFGRADPFWADSLTVRFLVMDLDPDGGDPDTSDECECPDCWDRRRTRNLRDALLGDKNETC
jgi:hypothetical protein